MVTKSMSLVTCRKSYGCNPNDKMTLTLVKLYGEAHSYTKKTGNGAFLRISYTGRLDEIVQWRSPLSLSFPCGERREYPYGETKPEKSAVISCRMPTDYSPSFSRRLASFQISSISARVISLRLRPCFSVFDSR